MFHFQYTILGFKENESVGLPKNLTVAGSKLKVSLKVYMPISLRRKN